MESEHQQRLDHAEPPTEEQLLAELVETEDAPPPGGTAYEVVGALVVLAIGVFGGALAWGYGLGEVSEPGPGMWPFIICVVIAALGVILLLTSSQRRDGERFTRSSLLPVAGVGTFIGLALLLPVIGFEIPALLLCLIWTRYLGSETWRSSILASVLTVVGFHLVFIEALGVPLPRLI